MARKHLIAVSVSLACSLLLAACGGDDDNGGGGGAENGGGGGAAAGGVEVSAFDFGFNPDSIDVTAGEEVELTFTNDGSSTHSFTSEDLDIDLVASGGETQETTFTAEEAGSIDFQCKFHPQMTGTIEVAG